MVNAHYSPKTYKSMKPEKIEILEVKPYGYLVINITKKVKQLIPTELLQKRLKWGLYEVLNPAKLTFA